MAYCETEEVLSLFTDISDEVPADTLSTSIKNSTDWIDNKLAKNHIAIPPNNAERVRSAAVYYSASDILMALFHGDEYESEYDAWFKKAHDALNEFIEGYLNSEAETSDLISHQMVKHSHGRTYNQKRRRRRWGR